ncbi:hypothetical protein [Marinimicrobium sp. ABcell2]|uniref:hypothetical protein n=1 Tax=Marinimicrobium sp. ABcell2 TaxID=3069751 RepID=UPI0027B4D4AF|nr:hypothetical protein [Marinimicrobium sp. ABcell2]MDQ2075136.1 hypothetical protein [Marinimicrobium sp. ABcell2]
MLDKAITDSWIFFKRHFVMLAVLMVPVLVPMQMVLALYVSPDVEQGVSLGNTFLMTLIGFVFYSLYMPAVIFYMASVVTGERRSIAELYQLALRWWIPFFVLLMLVMLSAAAGFLALIVPGIIIALKLVFAEFDMLLNGSKPVAAMKASWRLTKTCKGTLFGGYVIITLCIYVPFAIVSFILGLYQVTHWGVEAFLSMLASVCNVFYTIFAFRVYDMVITDERDTQAQEPEPSPVG